MNPQEIDDLLETLADTALTTIKELGSYGSPAPFIMWKRDDWSPLEIDEPFDRKVEETVRERFRKAIADGAQALLLVAEADTGRTSPKILIACAKFPKGSRLIAFQVLSYGDGYTLGAQQPLSPKDVPLFERITQDIEWTSNAPHAVPAKE